MLLLLLACAAPDPPPERAGRAPTTTVAEPPARDAELGAPAVDFVLEGADGEPIRLSDHRGQVILLDLSGFL